MNDYNALGNKSLNVSLISYDINYIIPPFLNNTNSSPLKIAKNFFELPLLN